MYRQAQPFRYSLELKVFFVQPVGVGPPPVRLEGNPEPVVAQRYREASRYSRFRAKFRMSTVVYARAAGAGALAEGRALPAAAAATGAGACSRVLSLASAGTARHAAKARLLMACRVPLRVRDAHAQVAPNRNQHLVRWSVSVSLRNAKAVSWAVVS